MKRIFVILTLFLCLCPRVPALYFKGAEGTKVRELQIRLYDAGLYGGAWDGVYSDETEAAVKEYQRQNGYYPDGICAYGLLIKLGMKDGYSKTDDDAVRLARFISRVCGDGDRLTQTAVASVALNRVRSPLFPDDLISVLDGMGGAPPCDISPECMRSAYEALLGAAPFGDVLYFGPSNGQKNAAVHKGIVFYK